MALSNRFSFRRLSDWMFLIAGLSILTGFILTILSWLNICTEACSEGHNYRLYGIKFEPFGVVFFITSAVLYTWGWFKNKLLYPLGLLLASGLGSEIYFILVQKNQIGTWCPLCLGIASMILLASITLIIYSWKRSPDKNITGKKGDYMTSILKNSATICMVAAGFLFAVVGLGQVDRLEAAESSVKEQLAFGDQDSSIETYIFTDWQCKACRKIEPRIKRMMPTIEDESKVVLVDLALHPESMNFTPYNLSFLIHNKEQYWKLRHMLTAISKNTKSPSEDEVEKGAAKYGVEYKQLNYSDVAIGMRYYKRLAKQFGVKATPTVVIINTETKKGKRLKGASQITEKNILKAIEALSS